MPRRTFATGGPVVPEENYFVKREQELTDFLLKAAPPIHRHFRPATDRENNVFLSGDK